MNNLIVQYAHTEHHFEVFVCRIALGCKDGWFEVLFGFFCHKKKNARNPHRTGRATVSMTEERRECDS